MSLWKEAKAADGRTYYYNSTTNKTQWDKPDDFDPAAAPATPVTPQHDSAAVDVAWSETTAQDGRTYYYNRITKVTTWDAPEAYQRQKQNARQAPALVAGGGHSFGGNSYGASDRHMDRRDDRDHGLPQKPSFEGGRGGGMPWERREESSGFRGPMPMKTDEPEYSTHEQAEEAFFKLLRKQNISPDSTWEEALRQVIREREYRAIKDPKERRLAFDKYCMEVRAQEKGKEKERREKLRDEFRKMLATHEDIKHYTRWKTARRIVEREAVFKSAGDEDMRRQMFDEYILGLKKKYAEDEVVKRKSAMQHLEALLQALIVDPNTRWSDAQASITNNERFGSDEKFKALSNVDVLTAFDAHMKALDRVTNDAKQQEKRLHTRRERQARDQFRELLQWMQSKGKIRAGTKWQDVHPLISQEGRYLNMIGISGSSHLDLFWDVVEDEERKLRSLRNNALDVLEDKRYEMSIATSFEDFEGVMRSDPKTASLNNEQLYMIYDRLMQKIKKRAEEDKALTERSQRKAIDTLRSVIKHIDPPVRVSDTYEDIVPRLQSHEEYQLLNDNGARRSAFDKHIRRLREKEEETERDRARRERDRDYRNGSRRDLDRDRDRRNRSGTPEPRPRTRTRTPEPDAYEADRRKAQADRERQYRKASFGLTPPPRERRDEREDRYRRQDRHESMSHYDRERRERETERERSYISRADPRDKGRTLDYGDEDAVGSRPGSIRKRRDSDGSASGRRDSKVNLTPSSTLTIRILFADFSPAFPQRQNPHSRSSTRSVEGGQPGPAKRKRGRRNRGNLEAFPDQRVHR